MLEYEEILGKKYSPTIATDFFIALKELPNVYFAHVYFNWNLIKDPDNNKFVDCYVAASADYLLSHDAHFSILKTVPFPEVNVITMQEFDTIINNNFDIKPL